LEVFGSGAFGTGNALRKAPTHAFGESATFDTGLEELIDETKQTLNHN
jgi:hypothetical protein